ncbi:TonB-dependent receptor [Prevotella sp. KH2C16]|uniref:TonB-dependent receptor n=1 Tax=Prevotella sp. KH2C16 TaxID=1855325 RepID=UPI0008E6ECC7|nr:TonB-dependent receptor [Prevotella sp. KH2C16]SFG31216.1 TonB-dependent receptor [Prevotella sp. KH2C16]
MLKMMKGVMIAVLMSVHCLVSFAVEGTVNPDLGSIKGWVMDADKQTLPGATITIEGMKVGGTSDVNGYYTLPNLKPGTYTIRISYVGYTPITQTVSVKKNGTVEQNFVLTEGAELSEVTVLGAFTDHRRAIQQQKNKMGVVNVVSADQVGKFPDSNIGDALKRINGVNVQYDQGEARFGQVRGTSADLTSVTVDGNRIPSAEGDTRNVQLDLIPADMVQTIELNKVVTSDMDGDAIGGEINLITKNTPNHQVVSAMVGTGYNWISGKPQWNLGFTYGNRFFDGKLGMMLAASYQYAPGGSDNTEFEYDVDEGEVVLTKGEVRQYYVTRQRQSYSAAFDYRFNINHKLTFKAIYNRRHDWENRYRITYKKLDEKTSKQSVVLQTKGGDDKDDRNRRLELQQTLDLSLGGEHQLGTLGVNWGASYSRATEDRPNERYFGIAIKDAHSEAFEDVNGEQPYSTKPIPAVNSDWEIDELTNSDEKIRENEWKLKLNFNLPLGEGARYGELRFGGKYVTKKKDRETHNFDYTDTYNEDWYSHLTTQIREGFMPGSQYPIGTPFVENAYLASIDFSQMKGEEILEDAAGNYDARENVTSAYLRYDIRLGNRSTLMAGLRMENTHVKYRGFNWIVDEKENESLVSTGRESNSYTNWLPSLLYKYDATDRLKLRASFTETLARPKYSHLIPNVSYNMADQEATIGNPHLKPTTSYNFDASVEYYFKSVGLASLGLFYKDLHNVIVEESWKGGAAEIPTADDYRISKPVNGYNASIFGVEVAYERDFGFITPVLRCLGFYGTYTYTHSNTRDYKFEHRMVEPGEDIKMQGTPAHTGNASLYFDKWGLNVRLSYNVASSFVDEMGTEAVLDRYYDSVNYLDLNASYTFGKKIKTTFFAEANNLLNQPLRYYQGDKNRTMQVEYYGVRFNCGVKINL